MTPDLSSHSVNTDHEAMLATYIRFFLENKLVAWLLLLLVVGWGLMVAPFDVGITGLPRDPVPVDAIPDIGDNQQIVYTQWPGRSPPRLGGPSILSANHGAARYSGGEKHPLQLHVWLL
jgi:hypothetical protein